MTITKPSLELLRELTDEHVLNALMAEPRLTRAELAGRTGISKPTVGESVRRLASAGVVIDTGERTTGRGRVGSYYAVADRVGRALAVSIAPEGITAELLDAHGTVTGRATEDVARPARPARVRASLLKACRRVRASVPTRVAVVSAADPVDRRSGRLVRLPDAPFLLGELSPVQALAPLIDGPVIVDNDVNWAARAERSAAEPGALEDFVYLFLGEGLGSAVVADGAVRRGHGGLAGEISHVLTTGPDGRASLFTEVFEQLGLHHPESTAIDVPALIAAVERPGAGGRVMREALGRAVGGVLSAVVALTDPAVVVIGGSWGIHPAVLAVVTAECKQLRRPPAVRPATLTEDAPLLGARAHAVSELRRRVADYRHSGLFPGRP